MIRLDYLEVWMIPTCRTMDRVTSGSGVGCQRPERETVRNGHATGSGLDRKVNNLNCYSPYPGCFEDPQGPIGGRPVRCMVPVSSAVFFPELSTLTDPPPFPWQDHIRLSWPHTSRLLKYFFTHGSFGASPLILCLSLCYRNQAHEKN